MCGPSPNQWRCSVVSHCGSPQAPVPSMLATQMSVRARRTALDQSAVLFAKGPRQNHDDEPK